MPMTKVDLPTFQALLDRLEEYDTYEDTVNGSQLTSYYVLERRIAQEVHSPDDVSHYLLDNQHCERVLKLQEQDYEGTT